MKAQRRHDLKQNVLDTELAKGADYLKRHLNLIGGAALLAALVALAVVGIGRYRESNREAAQAQFDKAMLAGEETPDALQHIADGEGPMAAIASCKLADDYAAKMLMAKDRMSSADVNDLAAKAKTYYNRVIDKFPDQNIQVANAHFGLGKLAESQGDLDTARKEYDAVIAGRNVDGLPVLTLAKASEDRLPDPSHPGKPSALDMNVYLAAGPAPEQEESLFPALATQPATNPATRTGRATQPAGAASKAGSDGAGVVPSKRLHNGAERTTTRPAATH